MAINPTPGGSGYPFITKNKYDKIIIKKEKITEKKGQRPTIIIEDEEVSKVFLHEEDENPVWVKDVSDNCILTLGPNVTLELRTATSEAPQLKNLPYSTFSRLRKTFESMETVDTISENLKTLGFYMFVGDYITYNVQKHAANANGYVITSALTGGINVEDTTNVIQINSESTLITNPDLKPAIALTTLHHGDFKTTGAYQAVNIRCFNRSFYDTLEFTVSGMIYFTQSGNLPAEAFLKIAPRSEAIFTVSGKPSGKNTTDYMGSADIICSVKKRFYENTPNEQQCKVSPDLMLSR